MTDITSIGTRNCDSCGIPLPDGELFYHCRTEIVAGKDEFLPDLKHPDKIIAQALNEIQGKEERELLDEIYQEIILQLCPDCKNTLLRHFNSMLKSSCESCGQCQGPVPMKKKGKLLQFPPKDNSKKD